MSAGKVERCGEKGAQTGSVSVQLEAMGLSCVQVRQVATQIAAHARTCAITRILTIAPDLSLKDFVIFPGVLEPMSSLQLASYLHSRADWLTGKDVLDMGTGTGIQGIIAAKDGAERVVLSDVLRGACENARRNVTVQGVSAVCAVVESDLFENIDGRFDVIVFAQPYFPGDPIPEHPASAGMLDRGQLICRFLSSASGHLRQEGVILMPFMDIAGDVNNPCLQGRKAGFVVREVFRGKLSEGLQPGAVHIYQLMRNKQ